MAKRMRAIVCREGRSEFRLEDVPIPTPGTGQVRIRVLACGLNPVDTGTPRWSVKVDTTTTEGAVVPGLDVAGIIDASGPQAGIWKPGDRVLCHGYRLRPWGGFAEYSLQPAAGLVAMPEDLDPVKAAATPCAGWTAWRALVDRLRVRKGESIFIAGGAGGVGSFALQLSRYFGLSPIITSCSPDNFSHVRSMGASHVLDYHKGNLVQEILDITNGRGVRKGIDAAAGDNDIIVANSLGFEGDMVVLSSLGRPSAYQDAFSRAIGVLQLSLGDAHAAGAEALKNLVCTGVEFTRLVTNGVLEIPINRIVSLEDIPEALMQISTRRTRGKIVAQIA